MQKWMHIYRNEAREPEHEAFACVGCGAQYNGSHEEGPPNGLCRCSRVHSGATSRKYLENFDKIKWEL